MTFSRHANKKLEGESQAVMYSLNLREMDNSGKGLLVLSMINKFTAKSKDYFQGNFFEVGMQMQGAAIINEIIDSKFKKEIMGTEINHLLTDEDIYIVVKNTNGFRPSLFISQNAFETLSRHLILKLKAASLDCAESVAIELNKLFHKVQVFELESFTDFKNSILQIIDKLITSRLLPTKEFISHFFEIEAGFINSKHPDFISSATNSINDSITKDEKKNSEALKAISRRERNEIDLIKQMLFNYFEVVKKNICDYIPKIIFTLLVGKTIEMCETEIISSLYKPEEIDGLLKENSESENNRKILYSEISELKNCLNYLNSN